MGRTVKCNNGKNSDHDPSAYEHQFLPIHPGYMSPRKIVQQIYTDKNRKAKYPQLLEQTIYAAQRHSKTILILRNGKRRIMSIYRYQNL